MVELPDDAADNVIAHPVIGVRRVDTVDQLTGVGPSSMAIGSVDKAVGIEPPLSLASDRARTDGPTDPSAAR